MSGLHNIPIVSYTEQEAFVRKGTNPNVLTNITTYNNYRECNREPDCLVFRVGTKPHKIRDAIK